jgi:hypothetical protein
MDCNRHSAILFGHESAVLSLALGLMFVGGTLWHDRGTMIRTGLVLFALLGSAAAQTCTFTGPGEITSVSPSSNGQPFLVGVGCAHAVSIPSTSALIGSIALGQFATLYPGANSLGLLTSNYGRLLVGL